MAKNITSATDTTWDFPGLEGTVFIKVTGTWGGTSLDIKTQNGNDEWETSPEHGTKTGDFARYYTVANDNGVRLTTTGGSGIDLWAIVVEKEAVDK